MNSEYNMHQPVLLKEVLGYLNPQSNQNFIDATVGDGGHAKEILKCIAPNGKLLAIDRDAESIIRAKTNLAEFRDRVLFINDSFGNIRKIAEEAMSQIRSFGLINGVLFDFGVSSTQLENSGRGFSFQKDEILDMRFDVKTSVTAEDIVNEYSEADLAKIFFNFGEEHRAKKIAKAIVIARKHKRIKTTGELVRIIEIAAKRRNRLHPATLIFQALRIEVNNELSEIQKALDAIPEIIKKGGIAAFILFHSLEDRLVKNWARNLGTKGKIEVLNKKPIIASAEELRINPRSRSAKLRIIEKL